MRKGKFYTIDDYEVTRDGNIINKHNGHIVKPQPNGKGYLMILSTSTCEAFPKIELNKLMI